MSDAILLDASCVLAWAFEEAGASTVEPVLTTGYITSVNIAEVITKIDRWGGQGLSFASDLVEAGLTVVPVGLREVSRIPDVRSHEAKAAPLSLGDVICLAYAVAQGMRVWTADRAWAALGLPIGVTVIR